MRVAIYCRVSTSDQSCDRQERELHCIGIELTRKRLNKLLHFPRHLYECSTALNY